MIKKAGQIAPRRLIKITPQKCQHLVKLGVDVSITGNRIKALEGGEILKLDKWFMVSKNKKVRRYLTITICSGTILEGVGMKSTAVTFNNTGIEL